LEFSSKNVLITGAASGIGRAVALEFAQSGANIAAIDISAAGLDELSSIVKQAGGKCLPLIADVSNDEEMRSVFEKLNMENLDIVFSNAGTNGMWSPIEELPVEEWDKTLAINLRGTFLTFRYAVPLMKQHGGSIVINSSVNGTRCFTKRGACAYVSSKAAQEAFGKHAALELAEYGIRVNVICPGATQTGIVNHTLNVGNQRLKKWVDYPNGIIPLTGNTWADAKQVAASVVFLSGQGASHISGAVLHIDGASSLIM
jgi:NAD(P)-dependent dehydrogenase (short-subunit alcohol dehydrogenase family)